MLPVLANGSTLPIMVGAVIYVRVSTKEQTENLSLPTQLRACEEYCRRQGYEILERFHEEGESAKSTDRSQLQNQLYAGIVDVTEYRRSRKARRFRAVDLRGLPHVGVPPLRYLSGHANRPSMDP